MLPVRVELPATLAVQLTETEDQLCTLLDECTTYLRNEKGINTSCRIAGGWVRDKLLGSQCNDIDIALEDIMGYPFAEHLAEFAASRGIATGSISKIEQNPDQSKHLETATFKILGLELDLVNLRSEEYADSSRIPTEVTFGTPLQDALRRDTTINALFYNVHSRSVEDCTEKGLDDLRQGTIRTPLSPQETFLDDPLRALRCIRFASRYGFEMVPELQASLKQPDIQEALVSKVSRERVGDEISKMMKGRSPLQSLATIIDAQLYDTIFCVLPAEIKSTLSAPICAPATALSYAALLQAVLEPDSSFSLPPIPPRLLSVFHDDPTCKSRLFLAAVLSPFLDITYVDRKKKTFPAVAAAIRESLKLGAQYHFLDGIPALFVATDLLKSSELLSGERFVGKSERVAIGMLLREKSVHNPITGSHWTSSLLFSMLRELSPLYNPVSDEFDAEEAARIIQCYSVFVARVEELNMVNVVDAKPLLDGREVVNLLNAKPGPWTGRVLNQVLEWQFENPDGTKDACSQWLIDAHAAGTVQVETVNSEPARKKPRTK
ncbi:hypothetical protein BDZ89DRAFT_1060461 [Hymenopellis radicata]|nr:hypothetical protein BDZ89DRAFT_1060461 [Hymenopellis radicata]